MARLEHELMGRGGGCCHGGADLASCLRAAPFLTSVSALASTESYTSGDKMVNWSTGSIAVVQITVHVASAPVANEQYFCHHGGARFVRLL